MKRLTRYLWLCLPALLLSVLLDAAGDDYAVVRRAMDAVVREGNRQYLRSNRAGIQAMADSLEAMLADPDPLLRPGDVLEYTAALYKLRGDWHYENGNYDETSLPKADAFFRQALDIYRSQPFGKDLDKMPMIRRELAQLRYREGNYADALSNLEEAITAFDKAYTLDFDEGDELYYDWLDLRMQKAICLARLGRGDEAILLADSLLRRFPAGSERYYESLRKKAKINLLSGKDDAAAEALPLYETFFTWKRADAIASLSGMTPAERSDYWMRMRPFVTDCISLEGESPQLTYDVMLFSKGLLLQMNLIDKARAGEDVTRSLQYRWKDVQDALPVGACAIEFVQYGGKMGAVVLRETGDPRWVSVLGADDFNKGGIGGRSNEWRLYSTSGQVKNPLYTDPELKRAVWSEELREAVGDCDKIYFSPDGYFHQLAIEYLLPDEMAGKECYRLTSTRQLIGKGDVPSGPALIAGGITYSSSEAPEPFPSWNDTRAYDCLSHTRARFQYLPATKVEAESIHTLRACAGDTLLTGGMATEQALRVLMGHYAIVNLSTHGYYLSAEIPQGTDLKPCLEDNTLSESVLALAGANAAIGNDDFDASGMDGLLSAAEIAQLDLSEVGLVVIAACQTGLGRVSGDGVYGMQRGFKNAGAGCLVVSLWNVDDRATTVMMTRLHENLLVGMTPHEAFFAARESLLTSAGSAAPVRSFNPATLSGEVIAADEGFALPQYYNAFILIDAIL